MSRAGKKIIAGMKEASAVARGEIKPARILVMSVSMRTRVARIIAGSDPDFESHDRISGRVLEALRDPTEAMVRAGAYCMASKYGCPFDRKPFSELGTERPCACAEAWRRSWSAAIEEALR